MNSGKKIAILAGQGAIGASAELEQAAEILAAPIVKALLGKSAVPDQSPYTTGQIGLVGTRPSQETFENCDTLLIAGSSFPYMEYYPKPGQARGIQIDLDPKRIGLRYPIEAGLVGDCKYSLGALIPMLQRNEDRSFLSGARKAMKEWRQLMEKRGTDRSMPMKPQVVAWELGKRLSETAIVSCDSGTSATWWARYIPVKSGQKHSISGNLATMACGLPYAIGAQVAHPDRQCVAFVGDGAFSRLMADFSTAVKYDLPVRIVVLKNNSLAQIKWEQIVLLGNPEFGCDFLPIDFAAFAKACGGAGFTIEDPADCGKILDRAFATPGPVIIEAVIDPNEPPFRQRSTSNRRRISPRPWPKGLPFGARSP